MTTDAQLRNCLHCMDENKLPLPNFRYGQSIFHLPHRPKFSDLFDLCRHWVTVVRGMNPICTPNFLETFHFHKDIVANKRRQQNIRQSKGIISSSWGSISIRFLCLFFHIYLFIYLGVYFYFKFELCQKYVIWNQKLAPHG